MYYNDVAKLMTKIVSCFFSAYVFFIVVFLFQQ